MGSHAAKAGIGLAEAKWLKNTMHDLLRPDKFQPRCSIACCHRC